MLYSTYAQLPPNSFGQDFTITDINGNEFNLHSTLNEGKTVILDLFAVWCGPCWTFAETGVLDDLQEAYPNDVVCVAVEADASTNANLIYGGGNSAGDWTTVIDYIMADDASGNIAMDYELAYYPTIYKICPDRTVTEVGQLSSVNAFANEINSCSSAQYSKDAKLLSYDGADTYCDGSLDASVTIQNYSVGAGLYSCNILTKANGQVIDTQPWSGSLNTYDVATIDFTVEDVPEGADITFEIDYSGDMDSSNNMIDPNITGSAPSSVYVTLTILTDSYPAETSWQLFDSNNNVIESTNTVGQAYGQAGDYSAGGQENVYNWTLTPGCYSFTIYDAYGDGLGGAQWGGTNFDGEVKLTDGATNMDFFYAVDFGNSATIAFNAGALSDIEEVSKTKINVFPNPFKDYTNLAVYYTSNHNHEVTRHMPLQDMNVEIYNNVGKVVFSNNVTLQSGENNIKIESEDLVPGLYYLKTTINGENNLHPLTIVE